MARERLDTPTRHLEDVMLRLRLQDGLPAAVLTPAEQAAAIDLESDGLLDSASWSEERLVLTQQGRLLADLVVRRLTA